MQINLRKANKLRKEIEARINGVRIAADVSIDVDDQGRRANPMAIVDAGRAAAVREVERYVALSGILSRLRQGIAAANVASGVDGALAEAADIDRQIKLLGRIAAAPANPETRTSVEAKVNRTFEHLNRKDADHSGYGAPQSTVQVNVIDAATAEVASARIAELRRAKEEVEDRRLGLNASTQIEIGEDDARLLRELRIV